MKKKINIRKTNILIVICLALVFTLISVYTLARYVSSVVYDYFLETQNFYFTSAHLDETVNMNNNWDGGPVLFELSNFNESDEVSDHEIHYTTTCTIIGDTTGNLSCELNSSGTSSYTGTLQKVEICRNDTSDGVVTTAFNQETCESRGYTWVAGNTSLNQYFEIHTTDPSGEIDNVKVQITATSTKPYKKTLTGEFYLKKSEQSQEDISIIHESYADYEKVIISNYSYRAKEFFLRWDASVLKITKGDYKNESIDTNGYINEIELKVEKEDTISFTFYKENLSDEISVEDFILLEKPTDEALKVTSIELVSNSSGVTEISAPTFSDESTNIHLILPAGVSTFRYEVTIENTTSDYYYLKKIEEVANTLGIKFVPLGLSLYHEFVPGEVTTFYIEYNGDSTITGTELILNLEYLFQKGKLYEDESLNGSTPEIIDGLIPIMYNETESTWEKADVVNGEWYDYSIRKWANAASVVSSKREYYVDASPGTNIPLSDITSMLVWIPRYSYTIKDGLGYNGYGGSTVSIETPGAIDIKFASVDTLDTGSGTYTGSYAENYYTPAAFCWGDTCDDPDTRSDAGNTEVKGFWIAKFEASKVGDILYSKPNMKPMINMSISSTFNYVQDLMNGVNGYNNYGYVGYVDAHLIKNTEWGAIAYLSQSKYGKYGNTDYTGANKEIYINNCSTYITGIGGSTPHQGSTTTTCYTNTYDTYYGMGASTTGNIYGVYDMVGGTFDRVMGILLDSNGQFIPDLSGFTTMPEGRYINVYPSGKYTIGDVSPIKGDALTETLYFYEDRYLGDPRFSASYYGYHWIYRGGSLFFSNTDANGIFSYTLFTGQADGHHSSRYAITMYESIVSSMP